MQTIRITTAQNIDIDYEVATVGDRILGRLIDWGVFIAFYLLILAIGLLGMDGFGRLGVGLPVMIIIVVFLYAFYDLACEVFMNGQSVGKRVMKIRVISLDGGRPTLGQYLIRWLLRIVDFQLTVNLCALISVIASEKKQRVGDLAAGTTLVKTHPRAHAADIAFAPPPENYTPRFPQANQLSDKDIMLIHEVLQNYKNGGNVGLLYTMATKVKELLGITPDKMDDFTFLEVIIADYNYTTSRMDNQ